MKNPWDTVSELFNTYKKDLFYGPADNIDTVWPIVLKYIRENFKTGENLKALDFGCGSGMFCRELFNLGFKTFGIDVSNKMIKIAKNNLPSQITLLQGNSDLVFKNKPFDLITSIMVLQFLENKEVIKMAESLNKNGHLIFANHNPEHLAARGNSDSFTLSKTHLTVPLYIRSTKEFDSLFEPLGLKRAFEVYESESPEFLKKYKIVRKTNLPKYMILGYKRN